MNVFTLKHFGQCLRKIWHSKDYGSRCSKNDIGITFHACLRPMVIGQIHDLLRRATTLNRCRWLRKYRITSFKFLDQFPCLLRVGVVRTYHTRLKTFL